jgi:hypothetical protein
MMRDEASRRGLLGWLRYAEWFAQGLQVLQSSNSIVATDSQRVVRDVAQRLADYDAPRREMLLTFCIEWIDDTLIDRIENGEGRWCAAEVWRAAGRRAEQRGHADGAQTFYLRAIDTARQQGALAWERRADSELQRLRASSSA